MGWIEAVQLLGGDPRVAEEAARDLAARYSEPHRRYHGLPHAQAVTRESDKLAVALGLSPEERAIVTLAANAHDVVYDARPGDDERHSAEWAREWLTSAGVAEEQVKRVESLVLATITHSAPADDLLATALLDADLATLGAAEDVYDQYARDVRQEYAAVDDDAWAAGRIALLERLLDRDPLYRSETARARWDGRARANLERELTRWRGPAADR